MAKLKSIVLVAGLAVFAVAGCSRAHDSADSKPGIVSAAYVSESGGTATASFNITNGTVRVTLPGQKPMEFYQAMSADGARYTNGAATFWEHQGEATCSDGNKTLFTGKIVPVK